MKHNLTLSLTLILGVCSHNAFSQSNIDVGKDYKTDNSKQVSVQETVNDELNPLLPNTDQKRALIPSIKSRNTKEIGPNKKEYNWGEAPYEPYTYQEFWNKGKKPRPNTGSLITNCISDDKKYCKGEVGKLIGSSEQLILRKSNTSIDENGFISDIQKPVLYNTGGNGYSQYFYRYWNIGSEGYNECPKGQTSCWSPSLPIVCLPGIESNYNEFKNLSNVKNGARIAKYFFGQRNHLKSDLPENGYYSKKDGTKENRYSILSELYLNDKNNTKYVAKITPTSFSPKNNICLDPIFDYDLKSNGEKTEVLIEKENKTIIGVTENLYKDKDISGMNAKILPCGILSENSLSQDWKSKEVKDKGFKCPSGYIYSTYSENQGDAYYTEFKIKLPKFKNIFKPEKPEGMKPEIVDSGKKMRIRACGVCEGIGNNTNSNYCTQVVRGVLNEVCGNPNNGKFSCNESQLDIAVKKLRTGNTFTARASKDSRISGHLHQELTCNTCLGRLEQDLISLLL